MKFSIWHLVVLLTIVCIGLAGFVGIHDHYRRAIEAHKKDEQRIRETTAHLRQLAEAAQRHHEKQTQPDEIYGKKIERSFEAKITSVVDGDTIKIMLDGKEVRVRLEAIDTPEPGSKNIAGQPFASQATEAIKELTRGKSITIHQTGTDFFGRILAFVEADGANVNAEMIRRGFAWY